MPFGERAAEEQEVGVVAWIARAGAVATAPVEQAPLALPPSRTHPRGNRRRPDDVSREG